MWILSPKPRLESVEGFSGGCWAPTGCRPRTTRFSESLEYGRGTEGFPDFSKENLRAGRRPGPTFPKSPLGMLLEAAGSGIAGRETRELGSARMLWEEGWTQGPGGMEGENWNVPESSSLTEP